MTELKPCPFCLKRADVIQHRLNSLEYAYQVHCSNGNCGAELTSVASGFTNKESAIKAWNTRPIGDKQAELLQECRSVMGRAAEDAGIVKTFPHEYAKHCNRIIAALRRILTKMEKQDGR